MSRFDAVVFDLDNTLSQYDHDIATIYESAFDQVGVSPFGEPAELWKALDGPPDPDDRIGYLGAGFARLAAQHESDADPIALATALDERIDRRAVVFVPGADRALDVARSIGPVGILTNGPRDRQRPKIDALGLDSRVDVIVYGGELPRRKPHVDPFEEVLDALGTRPERTLYVGDSLAYDVAGAHNAGLPVAWLQDGTEVGGYRPDFVLDSMDALEEVLAGG